MFPTTKSLTQPKRHTEWVALKKKHAAAIKAKKIAFDEKLGAALDKLSEHEAKMTTAEAAGTLKVADWKAHLELYKPVATLAGAYQGKLKGLGGPAEAELGGALDNLTADHKAWVTALAKLTKARTGLDKVQAAAKALSGPLGNLKTRTPEAIKEITKLVAKHKNTIPDPKTLAGVNAQEVQNNGRAALFELKLLNDKLKAAADAVAYIEKVSGRVAGDAAFAKFKDKAAGLNTLAVSPLTEAVKGIMNPALTIKESIQLNGIKAYGTDYLTNNDSFIAALRALNP